MLLNLNQKFVNTDGKVIQDVKVVEDGTDKNGNPKKKQISNDLTLHRIVSLALIEPVTKIPDGDKVKYFELALKINAAKAGTIELEAEDITLIKNAVKPRFGVLIVGEAMRMLEGKDIGIEIVEDEKVDPPEGIEPDKLDLPCLPNLKTVEELLEEKTDGTD